MRHWQLAIGTVGIDVSCDVPACTPILDAMLRLYNRRSEGKAQITFRIEQDATGDGMTLSVNDQPLWHGHDATETAAGFEVHFYLYALNALQPDCLSLHAATVGIDGQAVSLAGISGAGKSSLCTAAVLDGAAYLSDEFSLLSGDGHIVPFPRPLQWGKQRHPAFRHAELQQAGLAKFLFRFPDYRGKTLANLLWLPPTPCREPLPLATIVFPTYSRDAVMQPTPLRRSQALIEIATHMHHQLPPAEMIRELNRRIPSITRFFALPFNNARDAWSRIRQELGTASS
jgi:hypothetical protein